MATAIAAPAQAASTTYYVNCAASANGSGTQTSPWNSTASVNATTFGPGDTILFARGTTCNGNLAPHGSGSSTAPITVDAYGTGAQPVIAAGSTAPAAFQLSDQSYWTIQNLEITGGVSYGVYVTGATAGAQLTNFTLTNLNVHDTTGTMVGRGDSGEVFFYPQVRTETISNVTLDGVTAHDSKGSEGIYVAGAYGAFPSGTAVTGPGTTPIGSNVTVRNSSAYNVGGDGILLAMVSNGVEEHDVAYDSGNCNNATNQCSVTPSGLWEWYCQTCTVQYNESYDNHTWNQNDGGGYDIDNFNSNNILQYNYGHDNDGYCVIEVNGTPAYTNQDNVIRYNVCADNVRAPHSISSDIYLYADGGGGTQNNTQIYNNTIYSNTANGQPAFRQDASTSQEHGYFENNLVYSTIPQMISATSTYTLDHNLYYSGQGTPTFTYNGTTYTGLSAYQSGTGQDTHSLSVDPGLNLVGSHAVGAPTAAYTLAPGSPAIGAGTNVCSTFATGCVTGSMGAQDYYGNPVTTAGSHNIGAYDSPSGVSFLTNTGFEAGNCTGWNCYNGAAAVTGHAQSGNYAVQLPPNAGANQTITGLTPNTTYTLSGWGQSGAAGQCIYVGVKDFGGSETRACTSSAAYTQGTVTFTTGAANTSATIYLWNPPSNTATGYGDAVTVTAPLGELVLAASNTCLDVPGHTTTAGTQVEIWSCTGVYNQRWHPTSPGNQLTVYDNDANHRCLDDLGLATNPGAAVGIWYCNGGVNQQWNINPDGTVTTPNAPGLCLGVPNGSTADGTLVALETCNGSSYQHWSMR